MSDQGRENTTARAPLNNCCEIWARRGYVPLRDIYMTAGKIAHGAEIESCAQRLMLAFNGARHVQAQIARAALSGDREAAQLGALLRHRGMCDHPCRMVSRGEARQLEDRLIADTRSYLTQLGRAQPYPAVMDDECLVFDGDWAGQTLARSRDRLRRFIAARRGDTAVLVGNGPSLVKIDFGLLEGQDVYISNYAIRNARLHRLARGVAVSNRYVARQEPHLFQTTRLWKFHPLWLGDILRNTPETVYLNALGGALFFSEDVAQKIAWHSTVTFFWLQILHAAGYRKICLIGMDNAYRQGPGAREGELIRQTEPDENHFDPEYFRGKVWQAADTGKMVQTYRLARQHFEADGREIVNCTIGGSLEVFRRAALADELPAPCAPSPDRDELMRAPARDNLRRSVMFETARLLTGQTQAGAPVTDCASLAEEDPVRTLHARVSAFVASPKGRV